MSFRVVIAGRPDSFQASAGESILDAGRRAGFSFPQACRNGNCLRCEGLLTRGAVVHLRQGAETDSAKTGTCPVLPCIVAARSDCELTMQGVYGPGELPVVDVAAQVIEVQPLTPHVACIRLRLPAGRRIARLAGQYLEILDGDRAYAFSMASPPASGRDVELHLGHGGENPDSMAVLALLQREPVVRVRLPLGDCTLVNEPRLPLIIVAGATGFAQAQALVEHMQASHWRTPVTLYWAVRTADDMYLPEKPLHWQATRPDFRFVPVTTQDGTRIQDVVLADGHDPGRRLVYACGSPAMVYALCDALVAAGLPVDRMFSDVFAWAPR